MPFGNVFEKINSEYYQLTGAEKRVADYVVAYQQKSQFMSISELAEESGVAEATISRFCRRLGYKGYNAFKLAIANSTAGRIDTLPPESEITPEDTIEELSQKLYVTDRDAMAQTLELIRPADIRRAADILSAAEKVLCMGQGGSMLLAQECAHLFSTSLPNFHAVVDSHMQAIAASHLTGKDAVLYYSYSGSTEELLKNLKIVWERKAKTILITRFPKSPGATYADVVLQCGSREGPLQVGSVAARVDGAGELRTFLSVVFPMIKPGIGALAIFTFVNTWNDYFLQLVMLTSDSKWTLPLAIANLQGEMSSDFGLIMAGAALASIPIIVVFITFQKYFTQGIAMGAVKG